MEERDGVCVAAVFAADTDLEARATGATSGDADADQFANARFIDRDERIAFKNSLAGVIRENGRGVVT